MNCMRVCVRLLWLKWLAPYYEQRTMNDSNDSREIVRAIEAVEVAGKILSVAVSSSSHL